MFTCIAVGIVALTVGVWLALNVTTQLGCLILFILMSNVKGSNKLWWEKQVDIIPFVSTLIANTGAVAVFIALVVFVVRVNKIKT